MLVMTDKLAPFLPTTFGAGFVSRSMRDLRVNQTQRKWVTASGAALQLD